MHTSYGLRAFALYFIILGALLWFTLDNAVERLNDSMRQSAESVMVDMVNLLAELLERDLSEQQPELQPQTLANLFTELNSRELEAHIYNVLKTEIDSSVVVTDAQGKVIYDSTHTHVGADFSKWNDIRLTLEGKYGARTSYISREHTEDDDPKAMYVAAPVKLGEHIVGVVSLAKPIASLETHLVAESKQLQRYAFLLLLFALAIGYLLSLWFTYALKKIAAYANAMASAEQASMPRFIDRRLAELTHSISNMREQLDGKKYVEEYIHALTHELKTPITSIGATIELLQEPMADADRRRFLNNLGTSNRRMARLVDRLLSLARLEGRTQLVEHAEFDLQPALEKLLGERQTVADLNQVQFSLDLPQPCICHGDPVLLAQAIGNLLDNALRFCDARSTIHIQAHNSADYWSVFIRNQGPQIPDFALPKVFDRFFSLPADNPSRTAHTAETKSTGLGLSFVREIMKLHRGQVLIRNTSNGVEAKIQWPAH